MALDKFQPYLFVSAGEQSNKYLTPTITNGIAQFQAQRAQELTGLTVRINPIQEGTGDPSPTNIRPISGRTGMTVTVQSGETQNEYPVTWETEAGTVYGGTLDVVSGVLTVTDAQIASYAGETLPGEWISDRDVYAAGTTPTTGAQVVYKLATPQTYRLTGAEVRTLAGFNQIYSDAGQVIDIKF